MLKHRSSLAMMAALTLAAAAAAPGASGAVRTAARGQRPRRLALDEPDKRTQQQREIAEWNAAVDRRKAEKKASRRG